MKSYPFIQVDAFTSQALGGNPCAVFFDTDDLDDHTMLAITREMNLSESSFVRESKIADFAVRYFTPAEEIPLAGHPTIATVFALVESGRIKLQGAITTIHLELIVGPIPIDIYTKDGRVEKIIMTQKPPRFLATYAAAEVLPVFGLSADDLMPGACIQTVSTGTPQLMIMVKDLDCLKRVNVNSAAIKALREKSDWFTAHLFCLQGVTAAGTTFARHFSPPPDLLEDPFTGSATGGMAAYLWHYGWIEQPEFIAEQGHWIHRPGSGWVEVIGSREAPELVRVGGPAVAVLFGELRL